METSGFDIKESEREDNKYHLLRVVHESQSGFCRILEVKHSGRIFIAKTLKPEFRSDTPYLNLLKKEEEILSTLYHPSIIQTFGIVEIENEGPALILEYAFGVSLQSYLESEKITYEKAFHILQQICSAIDYCHKRGIIHRDLKPSNIMIYPQGPIVKIIDFNLSHSPSYTDLPLPGGTTNFSAPEQFEPGTPALPSSDIWSIGKIMQLMLPEGTRKWKRVSDLCMSSSPEDRPSSAQIIPLLLRTNRFSLKRLIGFLVIPIILFSLLLLYFLNDSRIKNSLIKPSVDPISDTVKLISQKTVDQVYMDSAFEENVENDDLKSIVIKKSLEESSSDKFGGGKEKSDITESAYILSAQLMSEIKTRAEEAASQRFKEQLNILDTAKSYNTIALAKVGHWRWKAKQDVSKWIKKQKLSNKEENALEEVVSNEVRHYEKNHISEFKKAMHDAFYVRGVIWVMNPPETPWEHIRDDEYEREVLGEDGIWRKETRKGKPQD